MRAIAAAIVLTLSPALAPAEDRPSPTLDRISWLAGDWHSPRQLTAAFRALGTHLSGP